MLPAAVDEVWEPGSRCALASEVGDAGIMLFLWCAFAACVFLVSLAVHVSTFCGIDPMEAIPGVMFIHLLIFVPFAAGIASANRAGAPQSSVVACAPRWLRIGVSMCGVYAVLNFVLFLVLSRGGSPHQINGRFVLSNHGRTMRELTEQEYHRYQAYVVRGFSGHWMLFSAASLMLLVGASRLRRGHVPVASDSIVHDRVGAVWTTRRRVVNFPKLKNPDSHPLRVAMVALIGAAAGFAVGGMKASFLPILGVLFAVFGDLLARGLVPMSRVMGSRTLLLAVVPLLILVRILAERHFGHASASPATQEALRHAYESYGREGLGLITVAAGGIICLVLGRSLNRVDGSLATWECAVAFFIIQVWICFLFGILCVAFSTVIDPN